MKKTTLILFMMMILMSMTYKYQISANYTIEHNQDGTINLTITVENGSPEYSFFLYDKAPWNEGQEIDRKENIKENGVTFSSLTSRDYFLLIQDAEKNITSVSISISTDTSN